MTQYQVDMSSLYREAIGVPGTCINRTFEASTGTSQKTAALAESTIYRLCATNDVRLDFGPTATVTAAATTMLLGAFSEYYIKTPKEATGTLCIAALSNDANAGTLNITPLTGYQL